jgi:succinyl-diaminopimelate desuccinylase
LTAALVAVPSVSRNERALADAIEARLRARAPGLDVERVGDNVVAQTRLGRDRRVVLGGHLDTVPANGNQVPRVAGDVLHGLGSADM